MQPEHAVAGLSGALAYLPFVRRLTYWFAVVIPLVGMLTATFLTPAITHVLVRTYNLQLDVEEQSGLAFMLGFAAMIAVLPAILKVINKLQTTFGGRVAELIIEEPTENLTAGGQAVIPRGGPDE